MGSRAPECEQCCSKWHASNHPSVSDRLELNHCVLPLIPKSLTEQPFEGPGFLPCGPAGFVWRCAQWNGECAFETDFWAKGAHTDSLEPCKWTLTSNICIWGRTHWNLPPDSLGAGWAPLADHRRTCPGPWPDFKGPLKSNQPSTPGRCVESRKAFQRRPWLSGE